MASGPLRRAALRALLVVAAVVVSALSVVLTCRAVCG